MPAGAEDGLQPGPDRAGGSSVSAIARFGTYPPKQQHMPERSPNDGSPLEETALDIRQAIETRREECADRRRDDEIGRCPVAKTASVRDGLVRRCTQRTARRRAGCPRPPRFVGASPLARPFPTVTSSRSGIAAANPYATAASLRWIVACLAPNTSIRLHRALRQHPPTRAAVCLLLGRRQLPEVADRHIGGDPIDVARATSLPLFGVQPGHRLIERRAVTVPPVSRHGSVTLPLGADERLLIRR